MDRNFNAEIQKERDRVKKRMPIRSMICSFLENISKTVDSEKTKSNKMGAHASNDAGTSQMCACQMREEEQALNT